jgi:hypothetical protein
MEKDADINGDKATIKKTLKAIFQSFQLNGSAQIKNVRRTQFGELADYCETLVIGYIITDPVGYLKIWRKSTNETKPILNLTVGRIDKGGLCIDPNEEIVYSVQFNSEDLTTEECFALNLFASTVGMIRWPDRLEKKFGIKI